MIEPKDDTRNSGEMRCSTSWSFLWSDYGLEEWPDVDYTTQVFEGCSFEEACEKMVDWLQSECDANEPVLDYEARAEHLMDGYNSEQHERFFPRVDTVNHKIKDYVR